MPETLVGMPAPSCAEGVCTSDVGTLFPDCSEGMRHDCYCPWSGGHVRLHYQVLLCALVVSSSAQRRHSSGHRPTWHSSGHRPTGHSIGDSSAGRSIGCRLSRRIMGHRPAGRLPAHGLFKFIFGIAVRDLRYSVADVVACGPRVCGARPRES